MTGRAAGDAELVKARTLLAANRAVEDTLARARLYGARAIDAIAGFPNGVAKAALTETVEFAIARAY
jgi:octaprenyl-diphosphate synthase